jgi:hypothetical protein
LSASANLSSLGGSASVFSLALNSSLNSSARPIVGTLCRPDLKDSQLNGLISQSKDKIANKCS